MTAYSKTISNSLRAFGGGPPSLWNAHNWNAFRWGEGTVKIPWDFVHVVDADDLSLDSVRGFRLTKAIASEPISLDSTLKFQIARLIANSLDLNSDCAHQYVTTGGYYRLFPGGTSDGEARVDSSWSQGSGGTPVWSQTTASHISWSAA